MSRQRSGSRNMSHRTCRGVKAVALSPHRRSGRAATCGGVAYTASKGALSSLTLNWAHEFAPIRAVVLVLGAIETPMSLLNPLSGRGSPKSNACPANWPPGGSCRSCFVRGRVLFSQCNRDGAGWGNHFLIAPDTVLPRAIPAAPLKRGEQAAREHPRNWSYRSHRDRSDRRGSEGFWIGRAFAAWIGLVPRGELDWRQTAARADLETGRSLFATNSGGRSLRRCCDTRATSRRNMPWLTKLLERKIVQGGRGGACQQDGAHRQALLAKGGI